MTPTAKTYLYSFFTAYIQSIYIKSNEKNGTKLGFHDDLDYAITRGETAYKLELTMPTNGEKKLFPT